VVRAEPRHSRRIAMTHFEIIETLGSPYGLLGRAALEQMKLG
jgi:hypothetical protein